MRRYTRAISFAACYRDTVKNGLHLIKSKTREFLIHIVGQTLVPAQRPAYITGQFPHNRLKIRSGNAKRSRRWRACASAHLQQCLDKTIRGKRSPGIGDIAGNQSILFLA